MNLSPNSRIWFLGLLAALAAMCWSFSSDFNAPWTDQIDGNGACWSQSAHNTLRAGLGTTVGVPSAFYFGTMPIPPEGYYAHHPPLLSLLLTGLFRVFGEKEWVARLLPVSFSLLGTVLLWVLAEECLNARAATFCVLTFAAMPMELRYGRMVNFEPINLVWMLGALLALYYWERTGLARWRALVCAAFLLSFWTAWLGYLFAFVVCLGLLWFRRRRDVRLVLILAGLSVGSLILFLLEVHHVRPDAWRDMSVALNYRMAKTGNPVLWSNWFPRMASLLSAHIPPLLWLLGLAGALSAWHAKEKASLRWFAWSAGSFFVMSLVYVVAFRNASSIHDYASFYFAVAVAMTAGIGLDAFCHWSERRGPALHAAVTAFVLGGLGVLMLNGERQTLALRRPFSILVFDKSEPSDLIPALGNAMRDIFGDDVAVICNFLPVYGPQLHYYAQHELLPCAFTASEWREQIADPENAPIGGVIWLQEPQAAEVLASLPAGLQTRLSIRGIPFCFWRPNEQTPPPKEKGGGG
jgi:hypothetical protein